MRVAIVVGLVLVAVNIVIIGARSQVDGPPAVQQRPVAIEALQPGESERIFPQQQIAVDLTNDLQGQLLVDHTLIPDDQIQGDKGLGIVAFQPGVGKEFREFSPGTHNATIEFWPRTISDVETARRDRKLNSYTWSFKVGYADARPRASHPGPFSSSASNAASSRIVTPSCSALASFEPGLSPDHDVARLLRHAAGDLAAARRDLGRGFVARAALERAGEHERQPGERSSSTSVAPAPGSPAKFTPASRSRVDQTPVAIDREPRRDALRDRRADAVDRGELLLARVRRSRRDRRTLRASACAAVGPTWLMPSPTSTRHSGRCFEPSIASTSSCADRSPMRSSGTSCSTVSA